MAGLPQEVYDHKLIRIPGPYILEGPVQLVDSVGPKAAKELSAMGVKTIGNLIQATSLPTKYKKYQASARLQYQGMY